MESPTSGYVGKELSKRAGVIVKLCLDNRLCSVRPDLNLDLFSADSSCGVSVYPVKPRRLIE